MRDGRETLLDLPAVWNVLRIGRIKIVLITLICALAAGYYAFVHRVPMYRATAVIVLETQFQKIGGMTDIVTDLPLGGFSTDPILFSEREVFKSRTLMQTVVDDLNLIEDPDFKLDRPNDQALWTQDILNQLAIDQLLEHVEIKLIPNSFAFEISAYFARPRLAQKVANAVAETYIQSQLNSKRQAGKDAATWLSKRVSELQFSLEQSEKQVQDFSAKIELLTEQDLRAKEIQLKELRARAREIEYANSQVYALGSSETSDPVVALKSTSKSLDAQTAELDFAASRAFQRGQNQLVSLKASIGAITDELGVQSRDLLQLEQIKREAEASRRLYESFLSKLKEVTVQQGIQRPDSRMLSYAGLPLVPVSIHAFSLVLTASFLGMLGGVFLVFLQHGSRKTFQTGAELEQATGRFVIGVVPKYQTKNRKFSSFKNSTKPTPAYEAFGAIRAKTLEPPASKTALVIMMGSAVDRAYTSLYAQALGQRIHDLGRTVLILDCDMRTKPDHSDRPALADILSGEITVESALKSVTAEGPDVLHAGAVQDGAADLLVGAEFAELMAKLRKVYDVIIVDTPPVLLFSDALVIANHCDNYLLCVTAEKTHKNHVLDALAELEQSPARLLGLILANADMRKPYGKSLHRAQSRYGMAG